MDYFVISAFRHCGQRVDPQKTPVWSINEDAPQEVEAAERMIQARCIRPVTSSKKDQRLLEALTSPDPEDSTAILEASQKLGIALVDLASACGFRFRSEDDDDPTKPTLDQLVGDLREMFTGYVEHGSHDTEPGRKDLEDSDPAPDGDLQPDQAPESDPPPAQDPPDPGDPSPEDSGSETIQDPGSKDSGSGASGSETIQDPGSKDSGSGASETTPDPEPKDPKPKGSTKKAKSKRSNSK